MPYKFQLKPNAKPARHAPRKVPIHLARCFPQGNQGFGTTWEFLEETKGHVTELGQQLCNHGEEDSN